MVNTMETLIEMFETDDPDQIADKLVDLVSDILAADREGDRNYVDELRDEFEEMVRCLAGAD